MLSYSFTRGSCFFLEFAKSIVSTHIIEVGEALKDRKNIRFVFMPTVMDGARPGYPYTLQEGITEDRQGMMIIRNEGILEMLYGETISTLSL